MIKLISSLFFECHICGGRRLAVEKIRKEIEKVSNPMMVDKEYLDGLERAIEILLDEHYFEEE
jgi:hypothetical protein